MNSADSDGDELLRGAAEWVRSRQADGGDPLNRSASSGNVMHLVEPLDEQFRERAVQAVLNANRTSAVSRVVSSLPQKRANGRVWLQWGTVAAAAAALVLWFAVPTQHPGSLPVYDVEFSGGMAVERGASGTTTVSGDPLILRPGALLTVQLRPSHAHSAPIGAKVWLLSEGSAGGIELQGDASYAPSGAVQLKVKLPAEVPAVGKLAIVVGERASIQGDGFEEITGAQKFTQPFRRYE